MDKKTIITRIWHGKTLTEHSDPYLKYIQRTGLRDYFNTPGNLSARVLRRIEGNICHFWTITEWQDTESIKNFAGNDFEKARYYPEDKKYLLEFEENVIHCETFTESKQALIIIDVQEGFFADKDNPVYDEEILLNNINSLIKFFRAKNLPVIFVRHTESGGEELEKNSKAWQIYSEINALKNDIYIDKTTPDSFLDTPLQEVIKKLDIKTIVISGLQTEYCIDATCKSAFGKKIDAILVKDAHSTYDNSLLKASEIINYHNKIIGRWFAKPKMTKEIVG